MKFEFLRADYSQCPPGEKPARFGFECPRKPGYMCSGLSLKLPSPHVDPGAPQPSKCTWGWNGSREKPTLHPSINCKEHGPNGEVYGGCGWHGWITEGQHHL